MDILLVEDKESSKILLDKIRLFLKLELDLELNKKTRIFPNKCGINYCRYIIYETHMLVRKRCKRKFLKYIKSGNISIQRINSFIFYSSK